MSGGIEDNSKIIFLFLNENISCDPSLEPSRRGGSNDGSQNIFYGEIWLIIPKLSLLPLLSIWSSGIGSWTVVMSRPHLSKDTLQVFVVIKKAFDNFFMLCGCNIYIL